MPRPFPRAEGRRSPLPLALAAAGVLAGLAWARTRAAPTRAAPPPAVARDGAAWLRHVGPALRRAGCATPQCHGAASARWHLRPSLDDAALAVQEFHEANARGAAVFERAVGVGHVATLRRGSCEAELLRAWTEGRPTRPCP